MLVFAAFAGCREASARRDGASIEALPATDAPSATLRHVSRRAVFDVAAVHVGIDDLGMSTRLDDVVARRSARVAVNGGFFDPQGKPVGLAVSDGKTVSSFSTDMSGGVLWIKDGVAHLTATEEYRPDPVDFAVQCKPRLVVGSRVNIRSDDGRRAPRTALCLRKAGASIEADVALGDGDDGGPTLMELATELADAGCEEALNLDGGPSTGWASRWGGQTAFYPPRAPVRHAVFVSDR